MRQDGSPWGKRPVRTVYAYAQMEIKLAVELSRCAALLTGAGRPAPGIEAVTRAALEAGACVRRSQTAGAPVWSFGLVVSAGS